MAADYARTQQLARDDTGTSGDQAEEDWAELISQWLPATYHVVKKGRILYTSGETSGQIDILVLSPGYPSGLLSNKLYLAAGVLAAFECKRTLRRKYIKAAVQASVKIKSLARSDRRVRHHIIYGLLAHSHDLPSVRKLPELVLEEDLTQADASEVDDPRDGIELICVPPMSTWTLMRRFVKSTDTSTDGEVFTTSYMRAPAEGSDTETDAIGRFLTALLFRLGKIDSSIAPIAEYFEGVGLAGTSYGADIREWPIGAMSVELLNALRSEEYDTY
jgi:hypothetical protein